MAIVACVATQSDPNAPSAQAYGESYRKDVFLVLSLKAAEVCRHGWRHWLRRNGLQGEFEIYPLESQ